jgi:hypothetical protein
MYKYSKEDYMKLTNVSCLDVALALGMTIDEGGKTTDKSVHIKDSGGLYIFPDKNNWYRHSDGAKGFPVDLVADALNCSREQALDFIAKTVVNGVHAQESYYVPKPKPEINRAFFSVPPHNLSPFRVIAYLIKTRGIDKDIVLSMIQRKMIAEDEIHHNCLFFGRDIDGNVRSCALRGTTPVKFRGEVAGGDKSYSFVMKGNSDTLRIFESPIDAMSHATFSKLLGIDWTKDHRISLNGCGNFSAVQRYLTEHPEIHKVSIALDNDAAGKKAAEELQHKLKANFPERVFAVGFSCSIFKDWNKDLLKFRSSAIPVEQFITMTAENIDNTPDDNEQQECYL